MNAGTRHFWHGAKVPAICTTQIGHMSIIAFSAFWPRLVLVIDLNVQTTDSFIHILGYESLYLTHCRQQRRGEHGLSSTGVHLQIKFPENKIRIFNTNVKAVLPYGTETQRTTVTTTKRILTFVNSCLRRILDVWWPETIINERLWQCTYRMPV